MGDERPSGTVFKHLRAKTKPGTLLSVMPTERHLHLEPALVMDLRVLG